MKISNTLNSVDSSAFPQNNIKKDNSTISCFINNNIDNASKGFKHIIKDRTKRRIIVTSILLAVFTIIVIIYLICRLSTASINVDDKSEGTALRMISRDEWLAQQSAHELEPLTLPVNYVIFAHTATDNCSTQASCISKVRLLQTLHMESRLWDDIGYNFLIGGNGAIYEGRGWDKQGAHTKGYNSKSLGIVFIGTFNTNLPPERQLQAAKNLLEEGVRLKKLSPNYKMYGHRQLIGSESPGKALFELIKTWSHWTDELPL